MFKRTLLAVGLLSAAASAQAASVEDLQKQIDILAQEIETMKESGVSAPEGASPLDKVRIGGYGEHHYNNYGEDEFHVNNANRDQVDVHRFVLFFGYDFSDKVRFQSEFEVEHGLAGESQPGEVEIEQAYIEVDTSRNTRIKLGQFLVPVGILNETHEPATFYGVERNRLEKYIIPTTWWETGAMLNADLGAGLTADLAFHSGLAVDNGYGIRGGRQKAAKATANDGAWTGRIRYNGIKGLELAATVQRQNDLHQSAANGAMGFPAGYDVPSANARLTEWHARYTIGPVTLTAMEARWDIDGGESERLGRDRQDGSLAEASYKITEKLGVFARHVTYDNNAGDHLSKTQVYSNTGGVNYWIHPQVVLKADAQNVNYEDPAKDDKKDDSVNLGIGWHF